MSLNLAILHGNVGNDPDVRMTPNGSKVATFSLATTKKYKDKSGNPVEDVTWHNIVAWNNFAELTENYIAKGDGLVINGEIVNRSWDDPATGTKKYRSEIKVTGLSFARKATNTQEKAPKTGSYNPPSFEGNAPPPSDDDLPF